MDTKKVCMNCSSWAGVVGRVLIGVFFLVAGIGKIMNAEGTASFMTSFGIPFSGVLVWVVAAFLMVAGIWIMTGKKLCWVAGLLAAYTVLVTLIFHIGEGQMPAFLKNLAVLGGLLVVMASCKNSCAMPRMVKDSK